MPDAIIVAPSDSLKDVYCRDGVLVVYKPSGVLCDNRRSFGVPQWLRTFCAKKYPFVVTHYEAGLLHRLDVGSSGPLIVGTTPPAYTTLRGDLKGHRWYKEYVALMYGELPPARRRGTLDYKIESGRPGDGFAVSKNEYSNIGVSAESHYQTIAILGSGNQRFTLVRVRIITGRTHQIRLHLREPARACGLVLQGLVGDQGYLLPERCREDDKRRFGRIFLHFFLPSQRSPAARRGNDRRRRRRRRRRRGRRRIFLHECRLELPARVQAGTTAAGRRPPRAPAAVRAMLPAGLCNALGDLGARNLNPDSRAIKLPWLWRPLMSRDGQRDGTS